ncbi:MAG: GMP/IMP nucleotidase [Sulfuricellaceae bacterium]
MDWNTIDTVLLDMDGTLLDLHFDNHFWLEHVPRRYAEKYGGDIADARREMAARYGEIAGTLQWYCVDHWTRELGLDIALLKEEVAHLIAVHPDVVEFLSAARNAGKRVVLVTNAHQKSLALKMEKTRLRGYFDAVICAHDLGLPKENPAFWDKLQEVEPFVRESALLVDDSLPVLRSAQRYGIAHLLAVQKPDTRLPEKDMGEFTAIRCFGEIIEEVSKG